MRLFNKKITITIASTLLTTSLFSSNIMLGEEKNTENEQGTMIGNTKNPKNIIFMVGDGMGPSYNTAYRHFADNPNTKEIEETAFDQYLKGAQKTDSIDKKENITDSAAAATAFSTGEKTYNGAISVDENKKPLTSVLERAKEKGKSTGLVATSELTDATPASYASHVDSRNKKDEIAKQFYQDKINGRHKVDVLLGGGAKYFGKNNGDLKNKFKKDGYDVVTNKNQLQQSKRKQILGLFADKNMPLQIDAPSKNPKLSEMQNVAIKKLEQNSKGFFLMVEGSQIDKSGHPNDITGVMSEMSEYEDAFKQATEYAKENPDTLVVATADHSTGGLTIGKDGNYNWNPNVIHKMKNSSSYMTEQIATGKKIEKTINDGYAFKLSDVQISDIHKQANRLHKIKEDDERYQEQYQALQDAIQKPINDKSLTGWTTNGHTGEDVNMYATGAGSEQFKGVIDNTDNAKFIFEFLNK